ncbi:hypothetical protein SFC43_32875 [Bacteroides sp. CR5/BHMF/2]|nr:hypothetical protein [Bacteroides sp. CR5/BHMF/2]
METVKDGVTGLFFYQQTADAIIDAVERFENLEEPFDPKKYVIMLRLSRKNGLKRK